MPLLLCVAICVFFSVSPAATENAYAVSLLFLLSRVEWYFFADGWTARAFFRRHVRTLYIERFLIQVDEK